MGDHAVGEHGGRPAHRPGIALGDNFLLLIVDFERAARSDLHRPAGAEVDALRQRGEADEQCRQKRQELQRPLHLPAPFITSRAGPSKWIT